MKRDGVNNNNTDGLTFDRNAAKVTSDAKALIVANLVSAHNLLDTAYLKLKDTSDLYAARLAILNVLKVAVDKSVTDIKDWSA